jgi:hypothetical protein
MYFYSRRTRDIGKVSSVALSDLVLKMGEFTVTASGVRAKIKPPLDALSRHYSWRTLPFGLSAMRALVDGDSATVVDRLVNMMGLNSRSLDYIDAHGSSLADDTVQLLNWSFSIADWCPYEDVAQVLRSMQHMDSGSTDRYVESFLS